MKCTVLLLRHRVQRLRTNVCSLINSAKGLPLPCLPSTASENAFGVVESNCNVVREQIRN